MKSVQKTEMFSFLVENAIDFLFKASEDIKNNQPKYSMLHFYTAVELFLKARLMDEHWSLIIGKGQDPDWGKFNAGDFISVSLEDAANRLKKVVGDGLSPEELKAFRSVAKHRNKIVHFFHIDYQEKADAKLMFRDNIVKQQLQAWYFLHEILTTRWGEVFSSWSKEIEDLNSRLMQLRGFLQVIFDDLKPEIEEQKSSGVLFTKCPSCEFEAQEYDGIKKVIYNSNCLVCGLAEKKLNIECHKCNETVTFIQEGFATCQSCGQDIEPEHVANALIDSNSAYIAMTEGDNSWDEGNCSNCDGYHTVVYTVDEKWVCASCFEEFESLSLNRCGWCNDLNTGDMELSSVWGCNHCDGSNEWNKDD